MHASRRQPAFRSAIAPCTPTWTADSTPPVGYKLACRMGRGTLACECLDASAPGGSPLVPESTSGDVRFSVALTPVAGEPTSVQANVSGCTDAGVPCGRGQCPIIAGPGDRECNAGFEVALAVGSSARSATAIAAVRIVCVCCWSGADADHASAWRHCNGDGPATRHMA